MAKDLLKFLLSALSGVLFIATLPHTIRHIPLVPHLVWLAFIPLLFAIKLARNPREAFLLGYLTGVVSHGALLYWLMSFGPIPVVLLTVTFSLTIAFVALFAYYMLERMNPLSWWWAFPTAATAVAFFEGVGLWGFPWLYPAYSLAKSPIFIQTADIAGVWIVIWLVYFVNIALFQTMCAFDKPSIRNRTAIILAAIVVVNLSYGLARILHTPSGTTLTVALIQGGIESDVEWTESYNLVARTTYTAATERALADTHADIVIWPESSLGDIVSRNSKYSIPIIVRTLPKRIQAPLLLGTTTQLGGKFFNSAVLVDESGEIAGISDKCVLIAFGEVLPFRRLVKFIPFPWGAWDIDRFDSFGVLEVPLDNPAMSTQRVARIATAICFDSVKPFVLRERVRRGADLIAIVTNNSWYKLPAGTEQHRMMDVFRAVENRRWAVRVAPTGVSQVIDPSGRIVAETKQFTPAHLIHSVQLLSGKTLYTRLGDWFGWICFAISIVVFVWLIKLGNPSDLF